VGELYDYKVNRDGFVLNAAIINYLFQRLGKFVVVARTRHLNNRRAVIRISD